MKSFFYRLFASLFTRELLDLTMQAAKSAREDMDKQRLEAEATALQTHVGRPVICFSNEVDNACVGYGLRVERITQAQNPVLIIKDFLSGEEKMILGQTYPYSQLMLETAFKTDKRAQLALLYGKYAGLVFNQEAFGELSSYEEVKSVLAENGFFEELAKTMAIEAGIAAVGGLGNPLVTMPTTPGEVTVDVDPPMKDQKI